MQANSHHNTHEGASSKSQTKYKSTKEAHDINCKNKKQKRKSKEKSK